MRWKVFAGAIMLVQLAGCRDVLGIRDQPMMEDAGAAGDAGSADAATAADSAPAPPTFCEKLSPPAQHCTDFEHGALNAGFDSEGIFPDPGLHGGATFGELRDASGRKLVTTAPALTADGDKAGANLFLFLKVRPTRLFVTAEMKVVTEQHLADNEALLLQVVFGTEGGVVIYRDSIGAAVAVVPGGKAARFPSWPVGSTHTIGVSVENAAVRGADGYAEASIDGVIGPELLVPAHFQNAGPPHVAIGVTTFAPVGEMQVVIDDVAVYWAGSR